MIAASTAAALKQRWLVDTRALGCSDKTLAEEHFNGIVASYGEAHRAYHTLDHLADVFAKLERHAANAADPLRLTFACWYHDIVYGAGANDNEAASAARARDELAHMDADAGLIARVQKLIRATASHTVGYADADDSLFLDADFSILGAEPEAYRRYVTGVRKEYVTVDDAAWRNGRGAFLALSLAKPRIFRTDVFESAYGAQARVNIKDELRALGTAI